ncbi:hypothetical protein FIV42_10030 [Persicimonas caeni]|uniref:Alpha-2-macroglobulin n=1 Tax=Persicimonas caeni TaxID=2292766 RepID=A0A4Y6PSG9_PERCE|nr:MG2 domain-containing protein [Persicimonas caeni]QDG51059.1 hypothetical protein FIV42_10030 [Persicimonas caeni]QED32280.1 hypothetical protein FRD00_10025 [Persicimonas caeni]
MDGKVMMVRAATWVLLATLLAVSPSGCVEYDAEADGEASASSDEVVEEAGELDEVVDKVAASKLPTAATLEADFRTDGPEEVLPRAFVVEFSHDIVARTGRELNGETEIAIEPTLAGRWTFDKRDRLVFRPSDKLEPGDAYKVTIESIGVERTTKNDAGEEEVAVTRLEPRKAWSHTYELPKFELVRMMTPVAVTDKSQAQVDLLFSAPVDPKTVDKYANWRVNGTVAYNVSYARGDKPHVVRATITASAFMKEKGYASVELALAGGLPFDEAHSIRAPAANEHKSVAFGERVQVENVALEEGVDGYYIYVICDDAAVAGGDVYFRNVIGYRDYRVSQRCTPDVDSAKRHIDIEPNVDFDIAPAAAGFQIRGDFKPDNYTVRLRPGLRTIDGGVLDKVVEREYDVGKRSSVVQLVGEGRYIPPEAWNNLAIRHRNVDELEVEVRHIPRENLVFWMSGYRESATARTSNLVGKTTLEPRGKQDVVETLFVDIGDFVGQRKPGVYEVHIRDKNSNSRDTARLLLTDINLLAKRSAKKPDASWSDEVFVWAVDMHTSRPKRGVDVKLIRQSGFVMARCKTGRKGTCRLDVPKKDVDPNAPFAIVASKGDDVTYLKYGELETQLTGADTGGEPYLSPKPYRAAVYGDRDLYRPAEEVHLVGVLRNHGQRAPKKGLPVEYELFDARGRTAESGVVETNEAGVIAVDYQLSDISPTGRWRLRLLVGKKRVAQHDFYVEEFVPERMEVDVEALSEAFYPEDDAKFGVHARYLFGASAKGSNVELRCRLEPKTFQPAGFEGYKFGPAAFEDADHRAVDLGKAVGTIGDDDIATLDCPEVDVAGSTGGRIVATASVFEAGSGRTTDEQASAWFHPTHYYIGLKADVQKVEDGKPVTINGVVVTPDGKPYKEADEVELEIVNLLRNYSWYYHRSRGSHSRRSRWQPLITETKKVAVQDGKFELQITPHEVRDGFAVRARSGKAETALQLETNRRYYWSWWRSRRNNSRTERVEDPTQLEIEGPDEIQVGKRHTIRFNSPYKGRALLTLETHRVVEHDWKEVEPGENTWTFTLDERVPNAYATVFLIKDPHLDSKMAFLPERAFGAKSLAVDRSPYRHKLEVAAPKEVRPNSRLEVVVDAGKLREPMYVTVAAVDEGILSLNNYETPDLTDQLIAKRALGVTTFDTVGWNVQMPEAGQNGPPGGGSGEGGSHHTGRIMPVKPVALWSGLVKLPRSGRKTIAFDVPNYRGELRVMAIAATNKKVASTETAVKVRDPLSIQTTTPRFLTAGDTVQIPVFVTNTTGKAQKVEVAIDAEAIELPGSTFLDELLAPVAFKADTKSATVADGESHTFVFEAKTRARSGGARFKVVARGEGIRSTDQTQLPIHPKQPRERLIQSIKLEDGKTDLSKHLKGWERHTERSTLWVSHIPYGRAFDHLKYLVRYPYGCVEQTSSSTRPMLFLSELMRAADPEGAYSKEQIDERVEAGVNRLLSMQTSQGGFGYWPGARRPDVWGTTIATHTLLDAKKAGYDIPQERLDDALEWLRNQVDNKNYRWANGYTQYVLALTGRANKGTIRRAIDRYEAKTRGWKSEQLYLLKAALYLAGDRRYEDDLKSPRLDADSGERTSWRSYYSDLRRKGFQLNVFVDLFGHDAAGEPLMKAVARGLSEHGYGRYNTQEVTWGVTGLGKWSKTGSNGIKRAVLKADGKKVPAAVNNSHGVSWSLARAADFGSLEIDVQSKGRKTDGRKKGELYLVISSEGVRRKPTVSYGGKGLEVSREFLGTDGQALDKSAHRLGDLAYVRLTVKNTSGRSQQNIALVDRVPAGWEIQNPRHNKNHRALRALYSKRTWSRDYMDVRDSKIAIFGNLSRYEEAQVVYPVRATLAGEFTVPSVHAESMYDADVWARKKRESITVKGPWSGLVD